MIKLIVVDDEPLVRIGLKSLIPWEENGFIIEGEAANGKEASELIEELRPDLVITDIKMPVVDGIELIRNFTNRESSPEFIVLSCFNDFEYVREAMKLGAHDYLIKSDIKPEQLLTALSGIYRKIEAKKNKAKQDMELADNITKSISILKENFFNDLIKGLVKLEAIPGQLKLLKIKLQPVNMALIMMRLDNFNEIKEKYAGQDEKFLKSTLVNLVNGIIPSMLAREIIIDSFSDYLVILNSKSPDTSEDLKSIAKNVIMTIKDFLNISVSVGISKVFNGFENISPAYYEAQEAVKSRFLHGKGRITFFMEPIKETVNSAEGLLDIEAEQLFIKQVEARDCAGCISTINELYFNLQIQNATESKVRKTYIQLIELIVSLLPGRPHLSVEGLTPYEEILALETMAEINEYVINFTNSYFKQIHEQEFSDNKSYVEQAVEIIKKFYQQDISLQSLAAQINLNPSYLSRIFKQEMNQNFISFLTTTRIEKAKYYLQSKKLKVYEVAEKVGYPNYTYFSRIFKKVTGVTPEEFQKQ